MFGIGHFGSSLFRVPGQLHSSPLSQSVLTKWKYGCDRGLSAAVILVLIASVLSMPHLHSSAARERRRLRAIERGFLVTSEGKAWIQVDKAISKAASTSAESMSLHRIHDEMCETVHHHGRLASLQAALDGHLSAKQAKEAASIHRTVRMTN